MTSELDRGIARRAFPLLVGGVVVLAVAVGGFAMPPPDVPAYALDSVVVYKCEVALASFLALYLLVVAILLAIEGRTVGKISTTGLELPSEISASVKRQHALTRKDNQARVDLFERDKRLLGEIDSLWNELDRLEHSIHREEV
jgi:hypothetical protein